MSENGNGGEFFAGFMIGGLVGAALALLLAPQPGEETRSHLKGRGIALKSRAEEWSDEMRQRSDASRSKVEDLSSGISDQAEQAGA